MGREIRGNPLPAKRPTGLKSGCSGRPVQRHQNETRRRESLRLVFVGNRAEIGFFYSLNVASQLGRSDRRLGQKSQGPTFRQGHKIPRWLARFGAQFVADARGAGGTVFGKVFFVRHFREPIPGDFFCSHPCPVR